MLPLLCMLIPQQELNSYAQLDTSPDEKFIFYGKSIKQFQFPQEKCYY